MQNMMDAALKYARRGWKVFPLQPNTKIPLAGSRGSKDATGDEAQIRSWWTVNPNANIALACGEASKVWVVDVDVGHKEGVNGFKSLEDRKIDLPSTLFQYTPSGGRHYLYTCGGERHPRNKNNLMPGIDIRGNGYYIVLCPSSIDGRDYKFSKDPDGATLAEYPEAMYPSETERTPDLFKPMPWDVPAKPVQPSSTITERATKYLNEIDPAVQGAGGHDKLMWAAQAMVVGFNLSDAEALDLLWNVYNPRCQPPWDRSNKADAKDFERKVSEARKHPIKEFGWLANEETYSCADDALDFAGSELAKRFITAEPKPDKTPEKAENGSNVEAVGPAVVPLTELPDEILNPPGLVGDITRYINATAGCYQPVFALGSAITFCGALFGRKVKDESNGRTNVYGMGVGHSSAGKDHPAKCIARIIKAARCEPLLGGEVTSDSAIECALQIDPAKLFMIDEVGHFLRTINTSTGSSPHLKTIVPMFMKLFSASNGIYIGKQKAAPSGRPATPPIRLDQPCCCIWGVTSPQILFDNMTREELEGGWTARNLVFISDTRPEYKFTRETSVPDSISTLVNAWYSRTIPPPDGSKDNAFATIEAHQIVVPTTPDAMRVFADFGHKAHELMISASHSGDKCNYLWGKALENARRIALIVTCGEHWDNAEIGQTEATYGCRLVEFLITRLSDAVHNNVAETGWEHDKQKILAVIKGGESKGISKSELTRATQWVKDKYTRDNYLEDLGEAGMIFWRRIKPERVWATCWLSKSRLEELKAEASAKREVAK